jgi:hypothetical protein
MSNPGRTGAKPYWNEIFQFGDSIGKQEPCHKDVCRRPIELLVPHLIADWANLKATSFVVIQNRPEDAW